MSIALVGYLLFGIPRVNANIFSMSFLGTTEKPYTYYDTFTNTMLPILSSPIKLPHWIGTEVTIGIIVGFTTLTVIVLLAHKLHMEKEFSPLPKSFKKSLITMNNNYMKAPRFYKKKRQFEIDHEKMVQKSQFAIKPTELIKRTQEVLSSKIGLEKEEDLSEDFVALIDDEIRYHTKKSFLEINAAIEAAFPDESLGTCHYVVDPFNHNRVWFLSFWQGSHTDLPQDITEAAVDEELLPVTTRAVSCPQVCSLTFDDAGKVTIFTGGYAMDKALGNTGGKCSASGVLLSAAGPKQHSQSHIGAFIERFGRLKDQFIKRTEEELDAI